MEGNDERPPEGSENPGEFEINDVLEQLAELEQTVSSAEERREVRRTKRMLQRVPGGEKIQKYTTRDVSEGLVGGIIFALPLLVEDGVFEIAQWFVEFTIGPVPIFLILNSLFIIGLTTGLLYYTNIREVKITRPIFGVLPRRLVGVLAISFFVAFASMLLWGRLHADDPTTYEQFSRITVIWAASAFGATLGDILPGESKGADISNIME